MNDKNIELTFSLEEVNTILTGLGTLPYAQVFKLIQKVQNQTEKQLTNIQTVPADNVN